MIVFDSLFLVVDMPEKGFITRVGHGFSYVLGLVEEFFYVLGLVIGLSHA